nr:hypothetical protein [Halomonas sp.]
MALLNAERLLSEWKEGNHALIQAPQINDTTFILNSALGNALTRTKQWNHKDVAALIERFFEWRKETQRPVSRQQARDRINRVLTALNTVPGMQGRINAGAHRCASPLSPTHDTTIIFFI